MLVPREQLKRLLEIQELVLEIQAARKTVEEAPSRIDTIEDHFRDRNAEYVAVKQRYEEIEADQRSRKIELDALAESRKKYMDALMQVKNQREYAAVLKELDIVKAQIETHEEAVIKDMEESETLKKDLDARADHIEKERADVETQRGKVETEAALAKETIERCEAERARIEGELPKALQETVRRVEGGRQGLFMARAEKEICQVCYVRIRPQVFQEIRQAAKIHLCSSCRRILYFEPLPSPAASSPASGPSPDGPNAGEVEAAGGGAV
jgi:hypothetical protein